MTSVFIDGSAGTTGLRIHERLANRADLQILAIPEAFRKDLAARKDMLQKADVAFLCLPDDAAMEAVALAGDADTVIIDTSTAHRTHPDWAYGFPELTGKRDSIQNSKRIANPGCHASGFISLVAPLVEKNLLEKDAFLSCFSLTGYSGGGKKMIAEYASPARNSLLDAPRMYGLTQTHKHLPEMRAVCGLEQAPVFCPIVAPFYSGMEVTVSLSSQQLGCSARELKDFYQAYYTSGLVHYAEAPDENGFLSASAMSGRDDMQIAVFGNEDRILLVSRFDNLGKGASGAAIQNMNLVLGLPEDTGLTTF